MARVIAKAMAKKVDTGTRLIATMGTRNGESGAGADQGLAARAPSVQLC